MLKQFIEQIDRGFLGGHIVPPFCGITRIFDSYYWMMTDYKLLNHDTLAIC